MWYGVMCVMCISNRLGPAPTWHCVGSALDHPHASGTGTVGGVLVDLRRRREDMAVVEHSPRDWSGTGRALRLLSELCSGVN